jgi:hypothetical protein
MARVPFLLFKGRSGKASTGMAGRCRRDDGGRSEAVPLCRNRQEAIAALKITRGKAPRYLAW